VQSGPSISSLVDLQLYVDLYSYPLQQLIGTSYSLPRPAACQHHKVLRPRQLKITLLTMHATVTAASICRVASPPTHELIAFTDANRYEVWHSTIREEIQTLRANKT